MKAINIRDFGNDAKARQVMGLFKHIQHKLDITQAELLKLLYTSSLKELNDKIKKGDK